MSEEKHKPRNIQEVMPSAEEVQRELAKAKSMDDFFGKEGILARVFGHTLEKLFEAEISDHPDTRNMTWLAVTAATVVTAKSAVKFAPGPERPK